MTTNSSSPNYVTDIEALGQRKNVLTGAMDSAIAGRDVAWNTGARYARKAASTDLKKVFDSNPLIQMEIFDTDGRLRHVVKTRYLGEIPPAKMAEIYVKTDKVSKFNATSLAKYLDFASGPFYGFLGTKLRNITDKLLWQFLVIRQLDGSFGSYISSQFFFKVNHS